MAKPRILVFAGSIRTGAFSAKLAALAAKELTLGDSEVSLISLSDYALPLYDADLEARDGAPAAAKKLRGMMLAHRGVFVVTPEYNASLPPLLKNAIDWISRAKEPAANPFKECVFALGSTSDGWRGGYRAIMALRQVLELGLDTLVVPEMISVPGARTAFDEAGDLKEERWARQLSRTLDRLVALCQAER
jgi:chromate reductase, NAD(P)H dehydrogenase (quinone)